MPNRISGGGFSPSLHTTPASGVPIHRDSQSMSARRRKITGASNSTMRRVVTYPVGFNVPHELIEARSSLL
ncbi:hypothetical protein BMS3Abin07_02325 [bacterium BMS3Abin07]|nr:hypothetical protein BMS3Abin07_02325 [bacterium BMS3Abin07]